MQGIKYSIVRSVLLTISIVIYFPSLSQQMQLETKGDERIIHLDSIGNIIAHEQALKLMRTGEYISIPHFNEFQEVEHLLKKKDPNNPEHQKYQVYTDGDLVISSSKTPEFNSNYGMGDTIASVCASSYLGHSVCLSDRNTNPTALISFIPEAGWMEIRQELTELITAHPTIDFLLATESDQNLSKLFPKSFLKRTRNVFMIDKKPADLFSSESPFPIYYMTDDAGKIIMMIPPLPNPKVAYTMLQKYISFKEL